MRAETECRKSRRSEIESREICAYDFVSSFMRIERAQEVHVKTHKILPWQQDQIRLKGAENVDLGPYLGFVNEGRGHTVPVDTALMPPDCTPKLRSRGELDLFPRGARTHCWECAETRRVGTKPERQDGRGTSFRYDRSREARHLREEPERDAAGRPSRAHCHGARKRKQIGPGRNWGVLEVPACYVSMLERPPQ